LPVSLIIDLGKEKTFDRLMLQEPIWLGQRVSEFRIWVEQDGDWEEVTSGTTIGYKRLLRMEPITTSRVKVEITGANNQVAISNIAMFKASTEENRTANFSLPGK
jgi:alpha-L-fucosidase